MDNADQVLTRSAKRWSDVFVSVYEPPVVFACQVNQSFANGVDGIDSVAYDNATGSYQDVMPNFTIWVGSSAGKSDLGKCRARKAASATLVYFGAVSDIQWQDNIHLTVVADVELWARPLADKGQPDDDTVFSPLNALPPVPVLGPMARVLELVDGTVTHTRQASASYSPAGSAISTFAWYAPWAASLSGANTATCQITYDTPGTYLEWCVITDVMGISSVGYRRVFVSPDAVKCTIESLAGDVDGGGFTVSLKAYSLDVTDRAFVAVWARDYIEYERITLGPVAGDENILFCGWIDAEDLELTVQRDVVEFGAGGLGYWLSKINGWPFALTDTGTGAPIDWEQMQSLTIDKAVARLACYGSTLAAIADITLSGSGLRIPSAYVQPETLLAQIKSLADSKLMCLPLINPLGQLSIERPISLQPYASRTAETLLTLTRADWTGDLRIERRSSAQTGLVELSGIHQYDGSSSAPIFSRAPGISNPRQFGAPNAPYGELVWADQDAANEDTGNYLAWKNNEFPVVEADLKYHLRHAHLNTRIAITMTADDNPLGLTWSAKLFNILAVEHDYNAKTGGLLTRLVLEAETSGVDGVLYVPPNVGDSGVFAPPSFSPPILVPPPGTFFPPVVQKPPSNCGAYNLNWDKSTLRGGESAFAYLPCTIPAGGATMRIRHTFQGGAGVGDVSFYACDSGGNRVISGAYTGDTKYPTCSVFFPAVGDTAVAKFEIALAPGSGTDYIAGDVIATGTVLATDSAGAVLPVTIGNLYSLESFGGPWQVAAGWPNTWDFVAGDAGSSPTLSFSGGYNYVYGFIYNPGTIGLAGENLDGKHLRVFFIANASTIPFKVNDDVWYDNTGSLGYILRHAYSNFSASIGESFINPVCAP